MEGPDANEWSIKRAPVEGSLRTPLRDSSWSNLNRSPIHSPVKMVGRRQECWDQSEDRLTAERRRTFIKEEMKSPPGTKCIPDDHEADNDKCRELGVNREGNFRASEGLNQIRQILSADVWSNLSIYV